MPQEPDSKLKVISTDLEDKDLYRLNQVIHDLYSKIDTTRVDGRFSGASQFQNISLKTDRPLNTLTDTSVLNYGELKKLGLAGSNTTTTTIISGGGGGGTTSVIAQYPPSISYQNAASRVLGEKVGETISVLDFGAVADGLTDDSPAFVNAISAALAAERGKRILIPACPAGSFYKLDSSVRVNNVELFGVVNAAAGAITWVSGDKFPSYLGTAPYDQITIDGTTYSITTYTDDQHITIGTALTASNKDYSAARQNVPIAFEGEGDLSLVKRGAALASASIGLFDIKGENISFNNFKVDGDVTTPTGLLYGTPGDFNNDPMNSVLTQDTSFWIHGPSSNITFNRVTITHTGGYSILLDATDGSNAYDSTSYDIHNTRILHCNLLNNRPHLFGTSSGDKNYGSWTGGIFLNTYGVQDASNYLSTVYNTLVEGCYFHGNYGNCIWSHLYGFDVLFSDLRVLGNTFLDTGLDCIQFGGISGGAAIGNRTRRTGYIPADHSSDVSESNPSIPKWLANANATALDTSGICKNVTYANNSFVSTNGGDIDADGFCDGQITGNVCLTPRSYDPEYSEDSISISGPFADGVTWSYGCQPSNSYGGQWGSVNVSITGNSFINKNGGAIRLSACRQGYVSGNNINHPATASYPPIILFNIGTGSTQRTYDTVVTNNTINYNPASEVAAIQEWGLALSYPAFQSGDKNWIHANQLIGNTYEFYKDATTSSTTGVTVSLSETALNSKSNTFITRKRSTVTGVNFDYLLFNYEYVSSGTQTAYLSDHGIKGIGGYVNRTTTSVSWVSGDKFTSFSNGDSIVINGTTYTISTVNSDISITLSGSPAGSDTAVVFTNPIYSQGGPFFNVGDGTNGSITTGNRSIIGFDDVMATNVFAGDGFLSVTDTLLNAEKANKLPDTYGLIKYDSTAKVFKVSNSATAGVRNWTTLGTGGSVAGSDKSVQFNDGGSFGGNGDFVYEKVPKLLTVPNVKLNDSLYWIEESAPAVSVAGESRIYMDSTSHRLKVSENGGAYQYLVTAGGGGTPGGANTNVQYNDSGSFGGSSNLTFISGTGVLTATGGVVSAVFNSTNTGSSITFQNNNSNFSVDGNGNISSAGSVNVTGTNPYKVSGTTIVDSSRNATFASVTATGVLQSQATGASITFQNTNFNFQVDGNGNISSAGSVNVTGANPYKVSGTTIVDSSRNATFASVTSSGVLQSQATGASIAFQNTNFNFQVDGNGNISSAGSVNVTGANPYKVGGTTIVDSSRNATFTSVTASGVLQSQATGSSISFQNTNFKFQVDGDGNVSSAASISFGNTSGSLIQSGVTRINSTGGMIGTVFNATNTGASITFQNNNSKFQVDGDGNVSIAGALNAQRNDGLVALKVSRTSATARAYGLAVNASGGLVLSDETVSTTRLILDTSGTLTIGSTITLTQAGAATLSGVMTSNGVVSTSGFYNGIQSYGTGSWPDGYGGMLARSFTAGRYIQVGSSSGTPTVTSGDSLNDGCMYYDTSSSTLKAKIAGSFVSLLTGAGSVTSATGTANQVLVNGTSGSAQTGALTLTLPQNIGTSSSPAFAGITLNNNSGVSIKNTSAVSQLALVLAADNNLYVDNSSNFDVYIRPASSRYVFLGSSSGGFVSPPADNNTQLGESSRKWSGVYSNGYYIGSSQVIDSTRTTSFLKDVIDNATSVTVGGSGTNGLFFKNATGTAYQSLFVFSDNNLYLDNYNNGTSTPAGGNISIRPVNGGYVQIGLSGASSGALRPTTTGVMTLGTSSLVWSATYSNSYSIGSTSVIDSSRNASFVSLSISGSSVIDSSRNANFTSLSIGGTSVVNSSRQITCTQVDAGAGNIIGQNFTVTGGFFGADATGGLVCGSRTLYFKSGILYAFI